MPHVSEKKALVFMHIATFLFGLTAVFGKLISLSSINLVWHRMWMASFVFLFFPQFFKNFKAIPKLVKVRFLGIGVIVAVHWLFFYGCIKVGDSASLALATFSTITIFVSILEPILLKGRILFLDVLVGIIIICGLFFVALSNPNETFSLQSSYVQAIGLGIAAAFFAALFSVLNKKYIVTHDVYVMSFLEMLGGFVFLTLLVPWVVAFDLSTFDILPNQQDIVFIILLTVLCTNIAFSFQMMSLKSISAFSANLILNLEPIYGILLAIILFKEHEMLNGYLYIGAFIISATVFVHPIIRKRINNKSR